MDRILVADDDEAIRTLLREVLTDDGYLVDVAMNGHEALALAASHHPDLILMDLTMPIMDGLEATRRLKSNPETRDIPVLVMSAGTNLRTFAGFMPADGLLAKPFDLDALQAEVVLHLNKGRLDIRDEPEAC